MEGMEGGMVGDRVMGGIMRGIMGGVMAMAGGRDGDGMSNFYVNLFIFR